VVENRARWGAAVIAFDSIASKCPLELAGRHPYKVGWDAGRLGVLLSICESIKPNEPARSRFLFLSAGMMMRSRPISVVVCLLWLVLVGVGFALVMRYENTPGQTGEIPGQWPAGTALQLGAHEPTLILFAHPRCPCTRATMEELNRLLAQTKTKASIQACFFQPASFSGDWSQSDLWRSAEAMPGLETKADIDGQEARRFGAETSGTVLLYDERGRLLFKGGITGGRGHVGDNAGKSAVARRLEDPSLAFQGAPVYGCSLLGSGSPKSP
jgi:hypothetical protein